MPKVRLLPEDIERDRLQNNLKLIQSTRTNEEMARLLCMSKSTYKNRMKNPEMLTMKEINRICKLFHISRARFCDEKLEIV